MLFDVTITARGPLAFPERRFGEQFRASLGYVPGGAIYGALGTHAFNATQFRELRCHNAYPIFPGCEKEHVPGDLWSRPLPMSALKPKDKEGDEGISDSLVERICWEKQKPAGLIYAPTDKQGRAWEVVKHGFYTLRSDGLKTRSAVQRVLTRVAIDRQRGTAAASRLYSPLVLNEVMQSKDGDPYPSTFRGSVSLPDDDALCAALKQIDALGARQTSGLGAVTMEVSDANGDDHLKQRVEDLTRRFREQAKAYRELGGAKWMVRGHVFTVNLLADAILREQGWLPTQELSVAALKELTGIEATLLRSFSNTAVVGGWHATWREPKPTALATSMGSVFVFHAPNGLSESDFEKLADLQTNGIGERRPEGFGQVRICDEFHITEALRH